MPIPASDLVSITPRVLSGTAEGLNFNGVFLTTNSTLPADTLYPFYSASEVSDYFGSSSDEYAAAAAYFNSFTNADTVPDECFFFRHAPEACAGFLRSGTIEDTAAELLAAIKQITDGTLTITIDGDTKTLTGMDFSSATSLSDVADRLQRAINYADGAYVGSAIVGSSTVGLSDNSAWANATAEYSSNLNAFTITSGTTGSGSSVTNASGDVAEALYLTDEQGAISSPGVDARSYTDTMSAVISAGQNWFSITSIEELESDEAVELAQWANTQYNAGSQFLFVFWSSDEKMLSTTTQDDTIAAQLLELNLNGTCGVYNSAVYAAFIMGACASVDWDKDNSTITLAYKAQSGLSANVQSQSAATALENIKMNFVGNYASRNDNFILLQHGEMFGEWSWIDSYLNSTWLVNELQVQILAGLQAAKRVPYNSAGYTLIRSWCNSVIERALANGVISTGVELSTSQKTELQQEAGLDISDELYNNGYYLQINEADATIRQSRESPDMNLWYTDAGSVHRISMPVTTVQ